MFQSITWMRQIIALIFLLLALGCNHNVVYKQKFDRSKWNLKDDMWYPDRNSMVDDLVKNHKLKGLTYKELTKLVGEPDRWESNIDSPYYEIVTDFGSDIDPVYTKSLVVYLNKDSVITSLKILEWNKGR